MKVIEQFSASAKGDKTEDLIIETPHYFGIFDGVTGVKADWQQDGKTMGQWAALLAAEALRELPEGASIQDYEARATAKLADARRDFGLIASDRLASTAIILPRRKPLEVWSIGDSHYGFKLKSGVFNPCAQTKPYDSVTLAYRQIIITQEIMERGQPNSQEERGAIARAARSGVHDALNKQMLWANHGDPSEKLAFGVLVGTPVPPHHLHVYTLPEATVEVILCSDGLPEPTATAADGKALLSSLYASDPFLTGKNPLGFLGMKGFVQLDGTVADCYDDVSYLRIDVR